VREKAVSYFFPLEMFDDTEEDLEALMQSGVSGVTKIVDKSTEGGFRWVPCTLEGLS